MGGFSKSEGGIKFPRTESSLQIPLQNRIQTQGEISSPTPPQSHWPSRQAKLQVLQHNLVISRTLSVVDSSYILGASSAVRGWESHSAQSSRRLSRALAPPCPPPPLAHSTGHFEGFPPGAGGLCSRNTSAWFAATAWIYEEELFSVETDFGFS